VPLPFLILTASLLLTTVVMFGAQRYVSVIDWIFLLSAAYLVAGAWWPAYPSLRGSTVKSPCSPTSRFFESQQPENGQD
jgi:hypothetical protein